MKNFETYQFQCELCKFGVYISKTFIKFVVIKTLLFQYLWFSMFINLFYDQLDLHLGKLQTAVFVNN